MESLTRTPFFCMLLQQDDVLTIEALSLTYKEFMTQLVQVCTNVARDIPAFFTLNYTYIELMALKEEFKARGVKKKCACRTLFIQGHIGYRKLYRMVADSPNRPQNQYASKRKNRLYSAMDSR